MKRILLFAILITMTLHQVLANHVNSVLSLRTYNNKPIQVYVDGISQGPFSNSFEIRNLSPGAHGMKVFTLVRNPHGWGTRSELVYRGPIDIYDGYEVTAVLDRFHGLVIEEVTALYVPQPTLNLLPAHCGTTSPSIANSVRQGNGHTGHVHPQPLPYMHPDDFNVLLGVISSKWFESTKRDITMQALSADYFTSAQIAELLGLFAFESTKLEIARFAYNRVVDQDRFYIVYDSFTFESSIRELTAHCAH